jgi:hypothetical protein
MYSDWTNELHPELKVGFFLFCCFFFLKTLKTATPLSLSEALQVLEVSFCLCLLAQSVL